MPDGLINPAAPTLASGAAPAAAPAPASTADPGEFGPSAAPRPAPRPSAPESNAIPGYDKMSFAQRRLAQDQRGEAPPAPAADPQAPPPQAATGEKVRVGEYETTAEELGSMMQRQAAEDLRKATLPAAPEAYEAKLPDGLKLPGGQTYTFDQNNPSLVAARNLAHAKGWSQQDFSEALGIFASHIAGEQAALAERSQQEIAKVGTNGPQRVDAVSKWITGMVGEADARPIRATIVTDAHVRFYEAVMNKLSTQGGASFSQSHRAPPDNNAIPNYDKMSFEQRRLEQDKLAARRGGR
jgi:hypothetical protein